MSVQKTALSVSAEALRRAQAALVRHPECFWTRQPALPLADRADVELVVRRLRENGGPAAWQTAREIEACL
jgi:hypothetical protein